MFMNLEISDFDPLWSPIFDTTVSAFLTYSNDSDETTWLVSQFLLLSCYCSTYHQVDMLSLSHEVRLTVLVRYRIRRSFHPLMYLMADPSGRAV